MNFQFICKIFIYEELEVIETTFYSFQCNGDLYIFCFFVFRYSEISDNKRVKGKTFFCLSRFPLARSMISFSLYVLFYPQTLVLEAYLFKQ